MSEKGDRLLFAPAQQIHGTGGASAKSSLPPFSFVPVRLPMREPFVTAAGTLEAREGFLVFSGDGVGEAMPLPSAGTETLAECRAALEAFRDGARLDELSAPCARFAIETALLDAEAKQRNLPLARLLDAAPRPAVQVNAIVAAGGEVPEGFRSYKVKVGTPGDLEHVHRVREQIGAAAELRLDANGTWSLPTAIETLKELEPARPSYCEDPLGRPDDVEALRGHTRIGIAADAWLSSSRQRAQVLERRLADVLVLKPAVLGGLRRCQALAFEARARGLTVVVTTLLEGVVGRLAALHLAAALPTQHAAGLATARLLARDHAADPAPVRDGFMALPPGPGLGVEVPR